MKILKICGIVSVVFAIGVAVFLRRAANRATDSTRWSQEGQEAVEGFLRTGANVEFASKYGEFIKLEGTGSYPPVWNIQGYQYLTLPRTGYFARGSVPIRVYVTEGRVTAPGNQKPGTPVLQPGWERLSNQPVSIFVSHPELR